MRLFVTITLAIITAIVTVLFTLNAIERFRTWYKSKNEYTEAICSMAEPLGHAYTDSRIAHEFGNLDGLKAFYDMVSTLNKVELDLISLLETKPYKLPLTQSEKGLLETVRANQAKIYAGLQKTKLSYPEVKSWAQLPVQRCKDLIEEEKRPNDAREIENQPTQAHEESNIAQGTEQTVSPDEKKPTQQVSRLAPQGTVYNVVRLSVKLKNGLAGIEPGTELKVLSKNPDGTLHVQARDLVVDVPLSAVTNDIDVANAARNPQ